MKRRKRSGGGASWMDTYGDMVTLLLCFFVLLYTISSVDQSKWENLVKSLNPNAKVVSQVVTDQEIKPGEDDVPESSKKAQEKFAEIYDNLNAEMKKMGVQSEVKIVQGEDYQFISYKDKVFFDGDSPVIRPDGKKILDAFVRAIRPSADTIKEIQVMGHTSQAEPKKPNNVETDRRLAAARSANVAAYIQRKKVINPADLLAVSYGQFHPIATFATREGREKNRRAEILILEKGSSQKSLSDYYKEVYGKGEGVKTQQKN